MVGKLTPYNCEYLGERYTLEVEPIFHLALNHHDANRVEYLWKVRIMSTNERDATLHTV